MKTRTAILILVVLGACLVFLGYGSARYAPIFQDIVSSRARMNAATSTTSDATQTYTVVDVVDGDTIDVDIGGQKKRVRYIGMDTPETVDPNTPVECYGKEASQRNKQLVLGQKVELVKDTSDSDKYGRLLRYVYSSGILVNLELVKEGYARALEIPPDTAHAGDFTEAEKEARAQGFGLWTACAGQ